MAKIRNKGRCISGRGGDIFINEAGSERVNSHLESPVCPLMPTKVLITYHNFLVLARPTYPHLKKKFLVNENSGIPVWTLRPITNFYYNLLLWKNV